MALFLVFTVWLIDLCLCIIGDMTQTICYASIGIILILILYMTIKLVREIHNEATSDEGMDEDDY